MIKINRKTRCASHRGSLQAGVLIAAGLGLVATAQNAIGESQVLQAVEGTVAAVLSLVTTPPPPNSETEATLKDNLPADTPHYFQATYRSLMHAPLPAEIYNQGGIPAVVPQLEVDSDPSGWLGTYQPDGPTNTADNAFFQALGTNGRSCVTCHQPSSAMSVSVRNIKKRLKATGGKDPIFAPVDGANCPNLVAASETSGALFGGEEGKGREDFEDAHSLLINKGLFRIALPVPAKAEYKLDVVSDPTTCNLDPHYNSVAVNGTTTRVVSVYRRPIMAASLNFKTNTRILGPTRPLTTNIMTDGREPSLESQAIDATLGHAQAVTPPTAEQVAQMVAFETKIFSAQLRDKQALMLDGAGASGGPMYLSTHRSEGPGNFGEAPFDEYGLWSSMRGTGANKRQSIARGQAIFNTRKFTISNVSGFNTAPNRLAVTGSCTTCHNFKHAGSDFLAAAQRDIGTGGQGSQIGGASVAKDLPVFKLTCPAGSFLWDPTLTTVTTNDPGKALITGKCKDIGSVTVPNMRGLAAQEPYFHDGSARTLLDVVNFYNKRFAIGFTDQEKQDLVNFLSAL